MALDSRETQNGNRLVDADGLPIAGEAQYVIGKVSPIYLGFNTPFLRLWKATVSAVLTGSKVAKM